MLVTVLGKGGSGKTTASVLLAKVSPPLPSPPYLECAPHSLQCIHPASPFYSPTVPQNHMQ